MSAPGFQWHAPLDPYCPDNPLPALWNDPMTAYSGCGDEIAETLEAKHRTRCKRCQEFGAANMEVVGP